MAGLIFGAGFMAGCIGLAVNAKRTAGKLKAVMGVSAAATGIIGAILILLSLAHPVPAGYVGVITVFGKPQDHVATEGLNFMPPWYSVTLMTTRTQSYEETTAAFTSDIQQADVTFVAIFRLPKESAVSTFKAYGPGYATNIVPPVARDALKQVIGKYTATSAVSDRSNMTAEVEAMLADSVAKYGIIVDDVAIPNIDFSDAYETSVELANKAKQDSIRIAQEAEQAQTKAEGEAAAKKAAADAEAYEITMLADAQAEANRKLSESITSTLVEYKKIEKWNGEVPTVAGAGATIVDVGTIGGND